MEIIKISIVKATIIILFLSIPCCSKVDHAPGSRGMCESCTEDIDCKPGLTCQGFF